MEPNLSKIRHAAQGECPSPTGNDSFVLESDLLPMEHQLSTSTISWHVHHVAERLESELGDEQPSFITGCPAQWYELPESAAPLTVSLDGGYVHACSKTQRKDGSFEVIVGKSTTGDGASTRFGLVSGYDTKPMWPWIAGWRPVDTARLVRVVRSIIAVRCRPKIPPPTSPKFSIPSGKPLTSVERNVSDDDCTCPVRGTYELLFDQVFADGPGSSGPPL